MLSFPEVCSLLVSLDEKMGRIAAAQDVNPWQLGSILFSVPIHMPSVLMTSLLINNAFAFRSTHVFLASKWWERRDFARQWKDRLFESSIVSGEDAVRQPSAAWSWTGRGFLARKWWFWKPCAKYVHEDAKRLHVGVCSLQNPRGIFPTGNSGSVNGSINLWNLQ